MQHKEQLKQIRFWIIVFMSGLFLSGITAFPLECELKWLTENGSIFPNQLQEWIERVYIGVSDTNAKYPFIMYGTDWLAFAHIIIGLLFIGPYRDPVKNKWIIDWAIVCCILIFPLALIAGSARDLPWYHIFIDCSFGIIGLLPLILVRNKIILLEKINADNK